MATTRIPYNFEPRDYQLPLLEAIDDGTKRAFCLWHRRAGKDKVLWNLLIKKAVERAGTYYYFFPSYTQAKKVIWDGIDNDGFPFLSHVPDALCVSKNTQELKIEIENQAGSKSIIQLIGTDNFDAVRGTNPVGCVFSEYAFHNPMAWEVIRPILAVNGGWAIFNTTPNGKNHAFDLWEDVQGRDGWFTQKLTVNDTSVVSKEILDEERRGMTPEMFEQEYFCSFDVGMLGSIYGEQMQACWESGRITQLPFFVEKSVDIVFDLGISKGNETASWFTQEVGEFVHFVNYFEASGKSFEYFFEYIDEYFEVKMGKLGTIFLPHDATKRDQITMTSAVQAFEKRFGVHKVKTLPPGSPNDSGDFSKVRTLFPRFKFDKENCSQGIRAIENYHYEYDQVKKVFRNVPDHNWASNGADALRYRAVSLKEQSHFDKPTRTGYSISDFEKELSRFD